jgi:hypothetical protein
VNDWWKQFNSIPILSTSVIPSYTLTFTNPTNPPSSSPSSSNFLGEQHYLKIVNHAEDYGQDGYVEDLDWSIEHHPSCKISMRTAYVVYECPMAEEIQARGLERLSFRWTDLEPGTYKIVIEQTSAVYYSSTAGSGSPPPEIPQRIVLL